jgi:hypothetical protein
MFVMLLKKNNFSTQPSRIVHVNQSWKPVETIIEAKVAAIMCCGRGCITPCVNKINWVIWCNLILEIGGKECLVH